MVKNKHSPWVLKLTELSTRFGLINQHIDVLSGIDVLKDYKLTMRNNVDNEKLVGVTKKVKYFALTEWNR